MPAFSTLRVLQSQSLQSVVRDEITRLILQGVYLPGSKLGEEELAEQLGVSRGPVREAFRGLEQAGLVRVAKNRGVFVRSFTLHEARELYVVRGGIEQLIARIAAHRITGELIGELAVMVEAMEGSFLARDFEQFFTQDMAYHDRLAQTAGNAKLLEIHRSLSNEMQLIRIQSIRGGGGILVSNAEHRTILRAAESRDGEALAGALHTHIMNAFERVAPLLSMSGEKAAESV